MIPAIVSSTFVKKLTTIITKRQGVGVETIRMRMPELPAERYGRASLEKVGHFIQKSKNPTGIAKAANLSGDDNLRMLAMERLDVLQVAKDSPLRAHIYGFPIPNGISPSVGVIPSQVPQTRPSVMRGGHASVEKVRAFILSSNNPTGIAKAANLSGDDHLRMLAMERLDVLQVAKDSPLRALVYGY